MTASTQSGDVPVVGATARRRGLAGLAAIPSRFRREVSSGAYCPEIDGLRFLAIAIVVTGHFFQRAVRFFPNFREATESTRWGGLLNFDPGLGVLLFFAVSGFIIASQARKARVSPLSGGFLKDYFGRRILRIEPPYIIMLVATWGFLTVSGYLPEGTRQFFTEPQSINVSLLGSLFYAHDLIWGAFPRLFPPGWSLEVEVQFYIAAPILFWLWFRLRDVRIRCAFALAVWLAATLVASWLPEKLGPLFVSFSILRYFGFFWIGVLMADSREWIASRLDRLPSIVAASSGWIGLIAFLALPRFPDAQIGGVLVRGWAALAIVAMFAGAFGAQSGFRRFCASPWIALVGGACYSIYLVHIQLIQTMSVLVAKHDPGLSFAGVLAMMAVQIAVVAGVGLTFYVFVERPFMVRDWPSRLLQRWPWGRGRADPRPEEPVRAVARQAPRRAA